MTTPPYTDADHAEFHKLLDVVARAAPHPPAWAMHDILDHVIRAGLQSPPVDLFGIHDLILGNR